LQNQGHSRLKSESTDTSRADIEKRAVSRLAAREIASERKPVKQALGA
jgi:hypothetical protein